MQTGLEIAPMTSQLNKHVNPSAGPLLSCQKLRLIRVICNHRPMQQPPTSSTHASDSLACHGAVVLCALPCRKILLQSWERV
jgi:hypothetical protein